MILLQYKIFSFRNTHTILTWKICNQRVVMNTANMCVPSEKWFFSVEYMNQFYDVCK